MCIVLFKNLWLKLLPANQNKSFNKLKELSEMAEIARARAKKYYTVAVRLDQKHAQTRSAYIRQRRENKNAQSE